MRGGHTPPEAQSLRVYDYRPRGSKDKMMDLVMVISPRLLRENRGRGSF